MKTALACFGFGRPEFYQRMLKSVGDCSEIINQEIDVFHFLDGGHRSMQQELKSVIEESGTPYKEIIARENNYGVGRQLISARRELLDERGYDRMIMMEDDIEVGKTYFSAILSLSDWAQDYEDVGTVQVWNVQSGEKEDLSNRMGELVLTNRHFVTYCLSKKVWDKIKPVIYEYEQKYLLKKDYLKRPHYRIRYFMSRQIKKGEKKQFGNLLNPPKQAISHPFPKIDWRRSPTSQDAITSLALHNAGLVRITTLVPRAFYFGDTGVHCTPEVYREMGFHEQGHWQWELEEESKDFSVLYKDKEGNWLSSIYR